VLALGLIELQCVRDTVKDHLRGAREVTAFHPDVVVNADPCEQRDLFSAQALDPAVAAVGGQAGLPGGDPCPPGGEELADLCSVVHDSTVGDRAAAWEVPPLPVRADTPTGARMRVDWFP